MRERREAVNFPMIVTLDAICIMTTITGTAAMALSTADMTRALMGLMCRILAAAPSIVAKAIAP